MTATATNIDVRSDPFRLGEWSVEPALNLLRSGEREIAIEPLLMNLLTYLAANPGKPAAKEDILTVVWHGVAATDESLSQAVFKLRKILGDDPDRPTYIETIRKKGYRLVAPVGPVVQSTSQTGRWIAIAVGIVSMVIVGVFVGRQTDPPLPPTTIYEPRPITSIPGRERDPSVSGDGKYIVYAAAAANEPTQIFLHGIGKGTQDRQLTKRGENRAPVFLPDDERVAFLRVADDRCTVLMMTLLDGAERILGDCSGNEYGDTAASPDGRWLAFNARDDSQDSHAIYLLDVQTGARRSVTTPPQNIWGDYDPAFTSDSNYLLFARSVSEGMQDVYAVDLYSGRETRLTHESKNIFGIAADRERVLFGSNRNGRFGIWSMGRHGESQQLLAVSNTGLVNPSLSVDGSMLVYEVVERTFDLTRIEFADSKQETLLSFNTELLHPDYSPTHDRIAFSSNRSGHYEIWDTDTDGQDLRRLTQFESGFTAHPQFSPDGQYIALDARPDGTSSIYVMNADGAGLRPITTPEANAYSPTWSRDGRSIYFSMETDNTLQIWRSALESGTSEQVTTTGGTYAIEGPDGSIYHVRPGKNGIWKLETDLTNPPQQLVLDPEVADWGNWLVTAQGILFYDRDDRALKLRELPNGNERVLASVTGTIPTADPAVAFDANGERAFITISRRLESDIELVTLNTEPENLGSE